MLARGVWMPVKLWNFKATELKKWNYTSSSRLVLIMLSVWCLLCCVTLFWREVNNDSVDSNSMAIVNREFGVTESCDPVQFLLTLCHTEHCSHSEFIAKPMCRFLFSSTQLTLYMWHYKHSNNLRKRECECDYRRNNKLLECLSGKPVTEVLLFSLLIETNKTFQPTSPTKKWHMAYISANALPFYLNYSFSFLS